MRLVFLLLFTVGACSSQEATVIGELERVCLAVEEEAEKAALMALNNASDESVVRHSEELGGSNPALLDQVYGMHLEARDDVGQPQDISAFKIRMGRRCRTEDGFGETWSWMQR